MQKKRPAGIQFLASVAAAAVLLQPLASASVRVDSDSLPSVPALKRAASDIPVMPVEAEPVPELAQPTSVQLPDSPGILRSKATGTVPDQVPESHSQKEQSPQPEKELPQRQQEATPHDPVGAAAAEPLPTTGVAASRPAGAALAPARQRRVRTILIRMGVLLGAGVAVGTTFALSQASPSKPPGSH